MAGPKNLKGATSVYEKTATLDDFTMATTVALNSNNYVVLCYQEVPADQVRCFGKGMLSQYGADDRGTWKLDVQESGGSSNIPGSARLRVVDSNDIRQPFAGEDQLSSDLTSGVKLERKQPYARERSKLVVEYKTDSATGSATATAADSTMEMPITIWTF